MAGFHPELTGGENIRLNEATVRREVGLVLEGLVR